MGFRSLDAVPPVRVRFAPSPTGYLHVGGARSALFNWLFARKEGGAFLLRIEDTDTERNREEWVAGLMSSLRWLGLQWDEPPVRQSERASLYSDAAARLIETGAAYYCDCTPEQVQERAKARGGKPGYDGFCRDRGLGPGEGRALRFRVPDEGALHRVDVVRGEADIELAGIEDFVILRSNGLPLYAFANTLDDVADGITHVLRGEDHLSNVPKQILIRRALGHPEPVWVHLPMIVNDQRRKLSKRRDKLALAAYQADGILP